MKNEIDKKVTARIYQAKSGEWSAAIEGYTCQHIAGAATCEEMMGALFELQLAEGLEYTEISICGNDKNNPLRTYKKEQL